MEQTKTNTTRLIEAIENNNRLSLLKEKRNIYFDRCHPDTDNEVYQHEVGSPTENREELIKIEKEILDLQSK